jgi:natural product precursor
MKKKTPKKLMLSKETVREIKQRELETVVGGRTNTCDCPSCGNRHSTCPV